MPATFQQLLSNSYNNNFASFSKCSLVLAMFFIGTYSCLAQKSFTTKQLLSKRSDSKAQQLLQDNLRTLKQNDQSMPLIDEYAFRTETDEFEAFRQEYLFRVSFNGKSSIKVQDKITKNNFHFHELKGQLLEETQLIKRYEFIVDWYYAEQELATFAEKKRILEDKRTIYKKMMRNAAVFDLDDLLKTEESLHELDQDILQLEHEKEFSIQQLLAESTSPTNANLNAQDWVSLKTMEQVLTKFNTSTILNLEQEIQETEINFAQLELEMEEAEASKVLDFAQLKYASKEKLGVPREFSLGLSLTIPTKSTNRIKRNEVQLDILDEKFKQELLKEEIEEQITEATAQFGYLLEEYQLIIDHINNSQLEDTYQKYKETGTVHPLTLLRIKESMLKNQRALLSIEKDACQLFLEILSYKGLLFRRPSVNYLSDELGFF